MKADVEKAQTEAQHLETQLVGFAKARVEVIRLTVELESSNKA